MILILLDVDERKVKLFGDFTKEIPFEDAPFLLPIFLKDREIMWIEEVNEVSSKDVMETVNTLNTEPPKEKKYIRSIEEGYKKVSDIRLTFAGPRDAKPIGDGSMFKSPTLQKMILENKVEIIGESQAKALKKNIPGQKAKDKALDSILLTKSVKQTIEDEESIFDDMDEVSGDEEVLTEAEEMVKRGIGKKE